MWNIASRHVDVPRRWRAAAAAVFVAASVVGCAGNASDADTTKVREQAAAALERWADAVAAAGGPPRVIVVGELTGQVGDWEPAVGDNKMALMAGLVVADDTLAAEMPPDAEVAWADGTTAMVSVISAREAVAAIQREASGPCAGCPSLHVTDARLTAGPVETTRGPAEIPVWELTVKGTAVKVTRAAVAELVTVVPPPWNPDAPPIGLRIDSASGSITGRELTVEFIGAPLPGDQACGEDYSAEAVESELAVVVIVTRHPHMTIGGCSLVGAVRTATAELSAPLGERAVLEVMEGLPVLVRLSP